MWQGEESRSGLARCCQLSVQLVCGWWWWAGQEWVVPAGAPSAARRLENSAAPPSGAEFWLLRVNTCRPAMSGAVLLHVE